MKKEPPRTKDLAREAFADKNEPTVSIVILSWNSKTLLETCLTSLIEKTKYSNYEVVVVDNGSSDNSVRWAEENFPWVDVIALDKNYGFSVGNNKGIDYALKKFSPEYVLLLNNDVVIVQENWLQKLVSVAESRESIGIVGCKLIYPDGRTQYIGTKLESKGLSWLKPSEYLRLPETYIVDAVLGACFLVKMEVIEKIGDLDIGFSPFGNEESDFCFRAKKAGYKSCMVSSVELVHLNRASLSKVNSEYVRLIARKNTIRFMLLNFPASWLVKRLPYEAVIRCFIVRNRAAKRLIPIKLRDGKDMLIEVKTNSKALLLNFKNLREIEAKRKNRTMKLPI
jgi:hypothetical protein